MMLKSKLSYQRLRQEATLVEDDDDCYRSPVPTQQTPPSWSSSSSYRRRWRLRISGLKRFFFSSKNGKGKGNRRRRSRRPFSLCRVVWAKVVKRLKESQAHFGELFAGNYLFLQVTPDYPFTSHYNNKNKYNTTAAAAAAAYLSSSSQRNNNIAKSTMMIDQKKVPDNHHHRHFPDSPSLDIPPPLYLSSSRVLTFN